MDARASLLGGALFTAAVDVLRGGAGLEAAVQIIRSQALGQQAGSSSCWIYWLCAAGASFLALTLTAAPKPSASAAKAYEAPTQKTFSYPDNLEYNYFDPDYVPDPVKLYADTVFQLAQAISVELGFQIDNCRNQSEHLLMLLTNEMSPADMHNICAAPQRLHKKLFKNYSMWCDRMGVAPKFSAATSHMLPPQQLIDDMLVFLLVWGESANLKHMPECLCYLHHMAMSDHVKNRDARRRSGLQQKLYHGYFLDMTVTPIYEVVAKSLKSGSDHAEKKTYDDFNEFFWSPQCLNFVHHLGSGMTSSSSSRESNFLASAKDKESIELEAASPRASESSAASKHVAVGLTEATKTYVEKRSWLHSLLTFHRVFEFHVVTFTLIAVLAFSNILMWSVAYTAQIASVVFWEVTLLGICWTALEIWRLYPTASIFIGPNAAGYVLRIFAGFVILVYQSIYYHWSFLPDDAHADSLRSLGGPNFWWWQYVWLSFFSLFIYGIEFLLCLVPSLTSAILVCPSDLWQSILSICYPFTELYVGKRLHVSQKEVIEYILFWVTLLAFKLWFGYYYVVGPLAVPTVEMYDDFMNFSGTSFLRTSLLLILLWSPHFMVYIIDLSIWYAVWASVIGGIEALIQRQGAVRDVISFRSHFLRLPQVFCTKLMPLSSNLGLQNSRNGLGSASNSSLTNLPDKLEKRGVVMSYGSVETDNDEPPSAASPRAAPSDGKTEGSALLYQDARAFTASEKTALLREGLGMTRSRSPPEGAHAGGPAAQEHVAFDSGKVRHGMAEFLDVRSRRWVVFSKAWNAVISKMREADYLSNNECKIYLFTSCEWFSKSVFLPLCITAGSIETFLSSAKVAANRYRNASEGEDKLLHVDNFKVKLPLVTKEAITETWELLRIVLDGLLGPAHKLELIPLLENIEKWCVSDLIYDRMEIENILQICDHVAAIVGILNSVYDKRNKAPVVTDEWLRLRDEAGKNGSTSSFSSSSAEGAGVDSPLKAMRKSVSYGFLAGLESSSGTSTESRLQSSTSVIFTPEMIESASAGGGADTSAAAAPAKNKGGELKGYSQLRPLRRSDGLGDVIRDKIREDVRSLLGALRNAFKAMTAANESEPGRLNRNAVADAQAMTNKIAKILIAEEGFLNNDVYASKQIDTVAGEPNFKEILWKLSGLLRLRQSEVEPACAEARRRINFFVNSLFMDMPLPPSVTQSKDYTCVTPYYSEDVLLTPEDLLSKNSDGVSTILYLQTIYRGEWANFLERRKLKDDSLIWSNKHVRETRMWASLRAQTLFRTVEGMMQTEAAIRFMADLESIRSPSINSLAVLKFNYVVACQVYGTMKRNMDSKADDIEFLLSRHHNLRVAYIDSVKVNKDGEMAYYSVLIKCDPERTTMSGKPKINEVYRVKLPGNPILGEGKPENQNHALIFSRGRYLQAVDMNQDGYFEEALKMRNLLEEFDVQRCTILGFREHIFTGDVSSVANYMALQEKSFVTLGQRVLNWPLRVRQHYGHPDLFDKMFVITEGGMSKASRGINLSEDVFAGFNATIRGHNVGFKEYAQVGKGRDVGLQQTYKFEAKLAQGNAEQSLSRDLNRICDRLDFFRLLSFYYGGIGHYLANTMVMVTLYMVLYIMTILAVYDAEGIDSRPIVPEGAVQLLLAGMGILQTLPLMATLTVEKGVLGMIQEISYMIISGGPLYFIFHIQTKCYYFQQTILAGGAMYRPTGRGFVIRHSPFDENYRFFASSHILTGFEVMCLLIIFTIYTKSKQYFGLTWSLWLIVLSFLLGPFWFNPVSFEWSKVIQDYRLWMTWMLEPGGRPEQSWLLWWKEDNAFFKKMSLSWRVTIFLQRCVPFCVLGFGICGPTILTSADQRQKLLELFYLMIAFVAGNFFIIKWESLGVFYAMRRTVNLLFSGVCLLVAVFLFVNDLKYLQFFAAFYFFGAAIALSLMLFNFSPYFLYKIHDYVVGHLLFVILIILSIFQVGYQLFYCELTWRFTNCFFLRL
jgi:hypothetical protein